MALKILHNVKAHSQNDKHQVFRLYEAPNHTKLEIGNWNHGVHRTGGPGWNRGGLLFNVQIFDLRK